MLKPEDALKTIPAGLRNPLIAEFTDIVRNFSESKWRPAELSGGRFCEVVYTILDGYAKGAYAAAPAKPRDFVAACRALEGHAGVPRSFQILIPRLLPALYEIRNNRDVGHVGGDVVPDLMDSAAVVGVAGWVMAELVRVFHDVRTDEAQELVNNLAERRLPLVWKSGDLRRVLDPAMTLKDQVMLLAGSCTGRVKVADLLTWTDYGNAGYFRRLLRQLHRQRLVEYYEVEGEIELLPPGGDYVAAIVQARG